VGGELVRLAYAASRLESVRGNPLTPNERAILLYMCAIAHDNDALPRYWGGQDALAEFALGRIVPQRNDDDVDVTKQRRSIHESVRKAVGGLVERGAIERVGEAFPGHSMEHQITVENLLQRPGMEQRHIGSSATTRWVNNNHTLSMTQPHVGPETKETHKTKRTPRSPTGAPHLRPVESGQAS
jgi:hypothetical protein